MSVISLPPVGDIALQQPPSPCFPRRVVSRTPPLPLQRCAPKEPSRPATQRLRVAVPPPIVPDPGCLIRSRQCSAASSRRSSFGDVSESEPSSQPSSRRSSRSSVDERAHPWSPCTKEEMWEVYDVFRFFSKGVQFAIKRRCFFEGLRECVSLKRLDVLRRTRLRERFRESAQDVTLEEFVRRYVPSASDEELKHLIRWSHLREAQLQLQGIRRHFGGSRKRRCEQDFYEADAPPLFHDDSVLRTIFDILDVNGDQRVSLEELQLAEILTAEEMTNLFEMATKQSKVNETKAIAAVVCGKALDALTDSRSLDHQDFCYAVRSQTPDDPDLVTAAPPR